MRNNNKTIIAAIFYFTAMIVYGYTTGLCIIDRPITMVGVLCTATFSWYYTKIWIEKLLEYEDTLDTKLVLNTFSYITVVFFLIGLLLQCNFER